MKHLQLKIEFSPCANCGKGLPVWTEKDVKTLKKRLSLDGLCVTCRFCGGIWELANWPITIKEISDKTWQ